MYVSIGWSHDEQEMSAGRILAGNARKLAQAISAGDSASAREELQRPLFAAESQGHGSMLLSSEWLLPALARPRRLIDFVASLAAADISQLDCLVILRSPLEQ